MFQRPLKFKFYLCVCNLWILAYFLFLNFFLHILYFFFCLGGGGGVAEGCCTSCMVDVEAFSLMCDLKFVSSYS